MSIHDETEADTGTKQTHASGPKPGPIVRSLLRLLLSASATAGRTMPVRLLLFVGGAYAFLWVPDIDLIFLSVLHHRSILTHSILPGLILLAVGRSIGAAPLAGALVGLSVHLSCDLLSPMTGFAQIWLPEPIKAPIGPLSYVWLAGNAILGFALASIVARSAFTRRYSLPLVAAAAVATGVLYGAFNEGSVASVVVVVIILLISLWPEAYLRRRADLIAKY